MPDEADPVRETLIATRRVEFPGTLSSREKPPRQRQSFALPGICAGGKFATRDQLPRAARRLTQILQPCCMSIFSIRGTRLVSHQHVSPADRANVFQDRNGDGSLGCRIETAAHGKGASHPISALERQTEGGIGAY